MRKTNDKSNYHNNVIDFEKMHLELINLGWTYHDVSSESSSPFKDEDDVVHVYKRDKLQFEYDGKICKLFKVNSEDEFSMVWIGLMPHTKSDLIKSLDH